MIADRALRRIALCMAMLVAGSLLASCSSVFFLPHRKEITNPEKLHLAHRDIEFASADGTALHGWLLLAKAPPKGTIVFLHGNAENMSTHVMFVSWLPAKGFNVFIADYRGYGRSGGVPEIAGAYADAKRILEVAMQQPETRDGNFVLFGQSLGGALALRLGASIGDRSRLRAVIAESAFSDYRAIAREKLAALWPTWLFQWPLAMLVNNRYSPIKTIDGIAPTPLLLIHGTADEVVPVHHSLRLYKAAREPKELWLYDRGHTRGFQDPAMRARFVRYLDEHLR
jgi:fermentation-respiration switch protein FrsA (DUF1100 family)